MYWPIAALAWWGAERAWRLIALLWVNGVFEGIWMRPRGSRAPRRSSGNSFEAVEKQYEPEQSLAGLSSYPPASPAALPYESKGYGMSPALGASTSSFGLSTNAPRPLPPVGFASAQLLPGRTVRLTIHTPHAVRWAAGQHLLLNIPGVRLFESHPYTIAGVDERAKQLRGDGGKSQQRGSEVVLLIRAQKGFSRALWDHVVRARGKAVGSRKEDGVLLRTLVSWPMGSSGRVSWGAYDSLLIVCGGTGITFGSSVLEAACRRMARQEQDVDRKFKTTRVRFVWIMREYGASCYGYELCERRLTLTPSLVILSAHLSWVASTLKRCIEMCDSSQLQVDLFVTHDARRSPRPSRAPKQSFSSMNYAAGPTDELAPPTAPFARQARSSSPMGRDSFTSDTSDWSDGEFSDSSAPVGTPRRGQSTLPAEYRDEVESVTDLVLFEGEDDYLPAAEAQMSVKIKKEGKLRRALSRRGQGGSLRRPPVPDGSSPTPFPSQLPHHDPSFEALPLDHRDEAPSPYRPYDNISAHTSSAALQASQADLGFPSHMDYTRESSYDFTTPYDDPDSQTLGGTDAGSTYGLVKDAGRPGRLASQASLANLESYRRPSVPPSDDDGFFVDVTEAEQLDIDAVAELAKTGYPRLKQMLDDEVERSRGKTVVACCGPSSLNSVVRNLVAKKIDLKRVAKGDPRGQVSLVVEDFAY